jgi:hypothetical protein
MIFQKTSHSQKTTLPPKITAGNYSFHAQFYLAPVKKGFASNPTLDHSSPNTIHFTFDKDPIKHTGIAVEQFVKFGFAYYYVQSAFGNIIVTNARGMFLKNLWDSIKIIRATAVGTLYAAITCWVVWQIVYLVPVSYSATAASIGGVLSFALGAFAIWHSYGLFRTPGILVARKWTDELS